MLRIVLLVYFLGMLMVLRGIVSLISWIDEKVTDASSHRYFWDIWFSTARMMAAWSGVCALVYMLGIERPSQPVDYLIATVFGLVYAALSGAVVGFLPALAAAANVDEGEAGVRRGGRFALPRR